MMRRHSFWAIEAFLLLLFAILTGAGFFLDYEAMWGTGLSLLVFFAGLIPIFQLREKRVRRYMHGKPLVLWTYSMRESDAVARDILAWHNGRNRWIPWTISACLLFIGCVFIIILRAEFTDASVWHLALLLLPALLPWLVLLLFRIHLKNTISGDICRTVIGDDFIIWGNTLPVLNEREVLNLSWVEPIDRHGEMYLRILYKSSVRMRYGGWMHYNDTLFILVPSGKEEEARELIVTVNKKAPPCGC